MFYLCITNKEKQFKNKVMRFFSKCTTLDEAKQLYKKLALENHPDRGGDLETMQQINSEYDFVIAKLSKESGKTQTEVNDEINLSEAYKTALNSIIALDGINIEVVGTWIWVTGNTYQHKATIKNAGYLFASKKQAWFFRTDDNKCKFSRGLDLAEIRSKYGSVSINKSNVKQLKGA